MKKSNGLVWLILVLGALALAFQAGAALEGSRLHRRECLLAGGYPEGPLSQECYFDGAYDGGVRERLDRSCPTGKGWYIYSDDNRYWRHKCG